jgi:hypothetical protein
MEQMQKDLGYFARPKVKMDSEDEYTPEHNCSNNSDAFPFRRVRCYRTVQRYRVGVRSRVCGSQGSPTSEVPFLSFTGFVLINLIECTNTKIELSGHSVACSNSACVTSTLAPANATKLRFLPRRESWIPQPDGDDNSGVK